MSNIIIYLFFSFWSHAKAVEFGKTFFISLKMVLEKVFKNARIRKQEQITFAFHCINKLTFLTQISFDMLFCYILGSIYACMLFSVPTPISSKIDFCTFYVCSVCIFLLAFSLSLSLSFSFSHEFSSNSLKLNTQWIFLLHITIRT